MIILVTSGRVQLRICHLFLAGTLLSGIEKNVNIIIFRKELRLRRIDTIVIFTAIDYSSVNSVEKRKKSEEKMTRTARTRTRDLPYLHYRLTVGILSYAVRKCSQTRIRSGIQNICQTLAIFLQKIGILNEGEMAEISLRGGGGYRLPACQNGILLDMLAAHLFWNPFVAFVGRREPVFVPNDRVLSERKWRPSGSLPRSLDLTGGKLCIQW